MQAVFLIFGAASIAWSVAIAFFIPDVLMTAWFLSKEDRIKSVTRVKENLTGIKNDTFKWEQFKEAIFDSKTWFVVEIQLSSNIANGGVNSVRKSIRLLFSPPTTPPDRKEDPKLIDAP